MFYWGYWIGPLIAVGLALWHRPAHLVVLGLAAIPAFLVSFTISFNLYDECDPCSTRAETLFWVNGTLFTIAPALFLLACARGIFNAWLRLHRADSSGASR
jgi:hypothetical protein